MKISTSRICQLTGLALYMLLAIFYTLIATVFPSVVLYAIPVLMLLFFAMTNNGKLKLYLPSYYIPWIVVGVFVFVGPFLMQLDNLYSTFCVLAYLISGIILGSSNEWIPAVKKMLLWLTGLYVFFTFFFWLFPDTYSVMIKLYGYVPIGTDHGSAGYRAGIAGHYSSNGIFISVFLMLLVVLYFVKGRSRQRKMQTNILMLVAILLAFLALLLSGKRGVLIWSVGALAITYLTLSKKKLKSISRVGMFALFGLAFLTAMTDSTSDFYHVFERFTTIGKDYGSLERVAMWKLALESFAQKPVFGNGFWSFRYIYAEELFGVFQTDAEFRFMDAHNVYLQVLCEMGIVGAVAYLLAVGGVLRSTLKLLKILREHENEDIRFGVVFSLCLQIFYLLYSLSGNCLYDTVFCFYGLAIALTTSLNYYVKHHLINHDTEPIKELQYEKNSYRNLSPRL